MKTPLGLIRSASSSAMEQQLREAAKGMRRWNRWLGNRHPYYNKTKVVNLRANTDINGPELGKYIACSALLHLSDGWNYLSRAFEAACNGDRNSAYHLAYYGELRAAVSLLASEGIGIFNTRHVAINDRLEPTILLPGKGSSRSARGRGTHQATWLLLSAWSKESAGGSRLLQAINVGGKSLSEWLEVVGTGEKARDLVAKEWLNTWSVDLRVLAGDTKRRNEMSYRPSRIRTHTVKSVDPQKELVNPLFDTWSELDPDIGEYRAGLDLALLRLAIKFVTEKGICNFDTLDEALEHIKSELKDYVFQALQSESDSSNAIFQAARISNSLGTSAWPILARAFLMLRVASARTALLLTSAEVSKSDLKFWWGPLGLDLGLWDSPDEIENFTDMWTDVSEARESAVEQMSEIAGLSSVQKVQRIIEQRGALTQFSRAPMWLLELD